MKLICIADTHNKHQHLDLPAGDVLIHAGDFTESGTRGECLEFLKWFSGQPHTHKILIAGNHDFYFEKLNAQELNEILPSNIHYLNDSGITIDEVSFWGSPITPGSGRWAFNRDRGDAISKHWQRIPKDTQVLITHTPPYGIMDRIKSDTSVGCSDLLKKVKSVQPKIHIFGHIHENYGLEKKSDIRYLNCSVLNETYTFFRPPSQVEV
ncbi:metallophosphatase domain-containing protein [Salegentibacter chungangensis]|uniref:Metallophosphatase domain-containing protein n=1 Tax=Salegentibacter chungangensis TaxID=1335724 RepID=A0ABW3NML4_9FLAO